MIEYKQDGWWKHPGGYIWIREHPNWKVKHPLGPVTFDYKCELCGWKVEDVEEGTEKNHYTKHISS